MRLHGPQRIQLGKGLEVVLVALPYAVMQTYPRVRLWTREDVAAAQDFDPLAAWLAINHDFSK